jgi:hypothetical protein
VKLFFSMKARSVWLLVALMWAAVVATPSLREMWLVHASGRSPLYPEWGRVPFYNGTSAWRPSATLLETRFPDDSRAQAVAIYLRALNASISGTSLPEKTEREFDQLIARFPHEKWLISLRLRCSLQWMLHNRLPGELAASNKPRQPGEVAPEKTTEPPNFTPRQLEAAIALARRGQQLEPDNAFWDWMRAQLCVYGWRDGEAWRALERGAGQRRYDTHEREWHEALIWATQKAIGRRLLVEEKDLVRRGGFFGSSPGGRALSRVIVWQALKAERRGDHAAGLRILLSFGQLQTLRAQGAYSQLESWLATTQMVFALGRSMPWNPTAPGEIWGLEQEAKWRGADFVRYAGAHGQAGEARRLVARTTATVRVLEQAFGNGIAKEQSQSSSAWMTTLCAYSAAHMLWQQTVVCGALCVALCAMLRFLSLPAVRLQASDRIISVLLLALVLAGMTVGIGDQLGVLGASLLGLPARGFLESSAFTDAASVVLPACLAVPALFVSCLAQGLTLWRHSNLEKAPSWRERWGQMRPAPLVVATALSLFTLLMLAWWQVTLSSPDMSFSVPREIAGLPLGPLGRREIAFGSARPLWPMLALFVGLFAGWTRWIFAATPQHRPTVIYRLCWLREMLFATTVLCSLFYFIAATSCLPARRAAEAEFQQILANGQIGMQRE